MSVLVLRHGASDLLLSIRRLSPPDAAQIRAQVPSAATVTLVRPVPSLLRREGVGWTEWAHCACGQRAARGAPRTVSALATAQLGARGTAQSARSAAVSAAVCCARAGPGLLAHEQPSASPSGAESPVSLRACHAVCDFAQTGSGESRSKASPTGKARPAITDSLLPCTPCQAFFL
jgi:hypothetical protein